MVRSSRTWETTPFLAARVSEGQLQEDLVDRTPLLATSRAGRLSIWAYWTLEAMRRSWAPVKADSAGVSSSSLPCTTAD